MPHSLVINFLPQSPIYPEYLTGRHIHALFLTLVSSVDKALGDRLHGETLNKTFTLSPIQQIKPKPTPLTWHYKDPIPAHTPCWWRISLLDDQLFGQLRELWLNLNPQQPYHLGPANLCIMGILGTPQANQPWANFSSYQQIYDQASDSETTITFALATPASFRQGQFDTLLPTPELVFKSLCDRWNTYSNIPIDPNIIHPVYDSKFNLKTEIVRNYNTHTFIGCVGEISYKILGEASPTQIKQLNALADYAIYAGVGRKTTMGMGMTKRL